MPSPFESIRIGSLELRNRLAMAPMKTALGTTSGEVTDGLVTYFRRRAEGGVGSHHLGRCWTQLSWRCACDFRRLDLSFILLAAACCC
jgi:2,4-dienoyl-CoA reductase-like NADH-dependent reductase (Old Yellow Enzyme family)